MRSHLTKTAVGHELTDLDLIEVPIIHHLIWRVQGYDIRLPGRVAIARYG